LTIKQNILAGTASGVMAGLILAGSFWLRDVWNERTERADQIDHISQLIDNARERACQESPEFFGNIGVILSDDHRRKALYMDMRERLNEVLDRRASKLTFDEVESVRRAFSKRDRDIVGLFELEYCGLVFWEVYQIEWLNLDPSDLEQLPDDYYQKLRSQLQDYIPSDSAESR